MNNLSRTLQTSIIWDSANIQQFQLVFEKFTSDGKTIFAYRAIEMYFIKLIMYE